MRPVKTFASVVLLVLLWIEASGAATLAQDNPSQGIVPNQPRQGAALLKTDILGVFAHPDDETGLAATLAYYARGRTGTVANVYCTRGEGGGNMVGTQWGASLGILREAELRDCLAMLGVRYCYFLDRLDWAYTESASATLEKWGKEETLERLVRLVRALRPEVIVTMNPAPNPGQHGHHQAAGLLATEAFVAAADPGRFPLQLAREGLSVWQAKRLFYGGGATNQVTPTIVVNETLADGQTPASIAGRALANHRSQAFGNFGNSPWLQRPQRFLLVKAFVANNGLESDLLGGLDSAELLPRPIALGAPVTKSLTLRFVPRPAVANYEIWVAQQGIEHVNTQSRADLPLIAGEKGSVLLEVMNSTDTDASGEVSFQAPEGWMVEPGNERVKVAANQKLTLNLQVTPLLGVHSDPQILAHFGEAAPFAAQTATRIHVLPKLSVRRVTDAPSIDGSLAGWTGMLPEPIAPTQVVEGKVSGAEDSSGTFRLAHDGKTLFVSVDVRDDQVVTNIASNDIRGHWRSDSVEICLDPAGGAEHTMRCYKVGIFPWDSSGKVRGARDADANQGLIEETAPGTRIASQRTADGYRVQAAIPFTEIGLKQGQKRLGFNLIIYDGDKTNALPGENINKSRIAWAPKAGVQGRPEDWGRIDLE